MRLSNANILTVTAVLLPPVALIVPLGVAPLLGATILAIVVARLRSDDGFGVFRSVPAFLLGLFLLWAATSLLWTPELLRGTRSVAKLVLIFAGGILAIDSAWKLAPAERRRCGTALVIGVTATFIYLAVDIYSNGIIRGAFLNALGQDGFQRHMLNRPVSIVVLLLWPALIVVKYRYPGWAVWLCLVLAIGLLAGSENATALVALTAGALVYSIASISKFLPALRVVSAAGIVVSVLALPLFSGMSDKIESWNALSGVENSFVHRLYIWDFAASRALEKPAMGWGIEATRGLARHIKPQGVPSGTETLIEAHRRFFKANRLPLHPHSAGLQIWVELGVIGVILFGGFLGWLCWCAGNRKQFGAASPALLALIVTGFAISSSGFGIWQSWWMSSIWLTAILTFAVTPTLHAQEHR
jgi:exopolysaccharide production protein ExoQ